MFPVDDATIIAAIRWQARLSARLECRQNRKNAAAVARLFEAVFKEVLIMRTREQDADVLIKALADAKAKEKTPDDIAALTKVTAAANVESPQPVEGQQP